MPLTIKNHPLPYSLGWFLIVLLVSGWNWAESNRRPNRVLTYRSFTGLAILILMAGTIHYPG